MLIKTDRLTVRYITEGDWQGIRSIWMDFSESEYAKYDRPQNTDAENVRGRIAKWAAANGGGEHFFFAVCLCDTVIGYIAFNKREKGFETGYCFHSAYRGKCYAKESMTAAIRYLSGIGITCVTAGTALDNTPSVEFLKSLGFRQTAREKVSFYKDADGGDITFDGGIFELTPQ